MYEEIFIMFKDGRKEWISPIEDLENDTVLNEEYFIVSNAYHTYSYKLSEIFQIQLHTIILDKVVDIKNIY